uniref:chorismate-binding protein n=1 Tax=Pseudonocardia pini TaxID=2758030 RepID=UPI0015F1108D
MLDTPEPWARFDDLVAGTAVRFSGLRQVLMAHRIDQVAPVLDEVDRLTRDGLWAFGFLSYEAAPGLDPTLTTHTPVDGLPLVWFGLVDRPEQVPPLPATGPTVPPLAWTPDWDATTHHTAVEQVRTHIAAGQTYQTNLTTRLTAHAPTDLDPTDLYRELVHAQRGAHNAYLHLGDHTIASASPELFFEQRGDRILMRPMKGTAARGRTTTEDATALARLRGSTKERAENIMIVDLVRNDLGRIAAPGSVQATRLLAAERYETVHQLTSDVHARLPPDTGLTDTFRALFPCGSVTGAPKPRTMELIHHLEPGPRGVYCGTIGIVGPPTAKVRARFSVAIRTVLHDHTRRQLSYGTGGGITWSSRPAAEHAELQAKAQVLSIRHEPFELLETLHHTPHGLHHLDAHLTRMTDSAHYFGYTFDPTAARTLLHDRLREIEQARVRLRCARDGTLDLDIEAAPTPLSHPVRLVIDPHPIDTKTCWTRHKTTRRTPYDTRLARHPTADDVVIINERGEITETCTANLAAHLDGHWWTPPLHSGCLPGIERAHLITTGHLRERTLHPDDLTRADDLALINSLRGTRPAQLLDSPAAP